MRIACIVPGSYIQIWNKNPDISGPQKADDMFLGRFSSTAKKYAKTFHNENYYYLTLKQGLLAPTDIVPSFEVTATASFDDPEAVSVNSLQEQWNNFGLQDYDLIVFLGTKPYLERGWADRLQQLLGSHNDRLFIPLAEDEEENFGIAKIKDAILTGIPLLYDETRASVRLKKIEILQLFDQYDYPNIDLFTQEKITILVAPNGFGKTTLMELIYQVFSLKTADCENLIRTLGEIKEVPFGSIRLFFDNGTTIRLINTGGERDRQENCTELKEREFYLKDLLHPNTTRVREFIDTLPFIPVKFIKSSRLTEYSEYSIRQKAEETTDKSLLSVYRDEIKDRIESLFSIYAEVSEDYECTAMARFTNHHDSVKSFHLFMRNEPYAILSKEEAINELKNLAEERAFLKSTGFLKVNQNLPLGLDTTDNITDDLQQLKAITLHVRDCQEKYHLFHLLRDKIILQQEIIKNLFLGKKFSINYENGFEVIRLGKIIDISKLSSGEQHQIILYYDLIFNSQPGTLVLIDEPEISIHIEWQREFLRNLQKISDNINCDFIVTTHSPDIVNDKWHLIVQLNEGMQ